MNNAKQVTILGFVNAITETPNSSKFKYIVTLETANGYLKSYVSEMQDDKNQGLKFSDCLNKAIAISGEETIAGKTQYKDAAGVTQTHDSTGTYVGAFPERLLSDREVKTLEKSLDMTMKANIEASMAVRNFEATVTNASKLTTMSDEEIASIQKLKDLGLI